jgi:hypothetical protein
MKRQLVVVVAGLFVAMLALSWLFRGTGVVHSDVKRNIYIPEVLTIPLQVKAAYDGERIFFRYRWPAERPYIYHDMMVYRGGKWERIGKSVAGPQPEGIYEDRMTMLVDDGSVPEFEKYGGYITIGDRMRFFTNEATKEEVQKHPYLGQKKKQEEVGKHLPLTRTDPGNWQSVVGEDVLAQQRKAGYFLDLWHWRAHRSNPIDKSDDQVIAEARYGDEGKGVFSTNWDADKKQPKLMFDPGKTGGKAALSWDDIANRKLGFDDLYYMREDQAKPFDANYAWKEGDTLPRRVLRAGDGSRADISVQGKGRWKDGYWDVTLVRKMDTGNPLDDKIIRERGAYTVGFAVHRDAFGSRWHYVSFPQLLGIGRQGDLQAVRFEGAEPKWDQAWFDVQLFYPGQVSWPFLNSSAHAGAPYIQRGIPLRYRHSPVQLANYGVEMEFREEIRRQWLYTLLAGLALIAGFGLAINLLLTKKEK